MLVGGQSPVVGCGGRRQRLTTDDGRPMTDDDESVASGQWSVAENDEALTTDH